MRWLIRAGIFLFLTLLTQLGGLAYAASFLLRRRLIGFVVFYALIWGAVQVVAPLAGRGPLPCTGEPLRMQSAFYCVTMRNFVTPEMADVAQQAAARVAAQHPGTVTLALDGSLPFFDGFPLIPHLSHDGGEKLDLAFYYNDVDGNSVGPRTRSPIGYFAFETLGSGTCPPASPTMRWDFARAQDWWPDWTVNAARTAALIEALAADARVSKIFIEPPLADQLGLNDAKIRFQGCRAERHDDHIHFQL